MCPVATISMFVVPTEAAVTSPDVLTVATSSLSLVNVSSELSKGFGTVPSE